MTCWIMKAYEAVDSEAASQAKGPFPFCEAKAAEKAHATFSTREPARQSSRECIVKLIPQACISANIKRDSEKSPKIRAVSCRSSTLQTKSDTLNKALNCRFSSDLFGIG